MPATRGTKRAASKTSTTSASSAAKNKKKRGAIQLEIPSAPKNRGRVLVCGQGDVGQLGLGEDVMETTKFKHLTSLGNKIVDVYAGGMHTIALDSNGKIWTFGCNDEGALGRSTSGDDEGLPKQVSLPGKVVSIAAGDSHSAALLNNGDVYAWGSFRDSHGSMGLVVRGREGKPCKEPTKVDVGEPAVEIASGGDHLVILTTSGSVLTMGCGEQGQLGRVAQRSANRDARQGFSALLVPSKVTLKQGASRVWAGYHATFALDATHHKVFAWGLNNYGQLGITGEKRKTALYAPTECDAFTACNQTWGSVACGQHHTLALDCAGQVYAVGRHDYGRLGLGSRTEDAEALEPIPQLQNKKCVSIAAGTCNSFAVTETGEVLAWGMGSEGQLGTGSSSDADEPTPASIPTQQPCVPLRVSAGGQHTVILAEDPSSHKEPTPEPEKETEEEKTEEVKEEKPPRKRQKTDQEGEVSSTSSAQPDEEKAKPQKVNGDDKIEETMEVDQTDNTQNKEEKTDESQDSNTDGQTDEKNMDTDSQGSDSQDKIEEKQETDSQGSDQGTQVTQAKEQVKDVEMTETVNGTPETEVEPKTVEGIALSANPITTSA